MPVLVVAPVFGALIGFIAGSVVLAYHRALSGLMGWDPLAGQVASGLSGVATLTGAALAFAAAVWVVATTR